MMEDESFELDDDEHSDDDRGEPKKLSDHPEAKRARERRAGKRSGSSRRTPSSSEIRTRLRESIAALADAFDERDPELSNTLKRDGPKMAELLGKWADHPKTPAPVKVAIVVIAEVLEPLRAFAGTGRLLLRRFRDRRQARADEWVGDESEGVVPVFENEPPAVPTPDRFRVDVEPPDVN